ncbi:MAG: alpha-glucosidase, partial [Thermoleophilaceae bacterium]|nr:alpha-glucosidase [Thermoleophilaceae bacterium]
AGLRLRRSDVIEAGAFAWLPSDPDILAFSRGDKFACITNLGAGPAELPPGSTVLLASNPVEAGQLPQDTTAWLRLPKGFLTAHPPPRNAPRTQRRHDKEGP